MAVLTEITNSDKDLLLDGDCTIKTELLISDTKLPGPSYEMQYDTENDYYYLNGESYQATSTQSANLCPPFTDSRWIFTNGASVTNEGYLSVPATTGASATIIIPWNKSRTCYFKDIIVSGGNAHYAGDYFDESGTLLQGNGKTIFDKNTNYQDKTMWGGNNKYGDALIQATNIKFTIKFSNYTSNPYVIKDLIISENDINYIPFTPDMPSPEYPSPISSVKGQIQMVVPYPTDKKLLTVDLGNNELCSLPRDVYNRLLCDRLIYDTKRNIFDKNAIALNGTSSVKTTLDTGIRSTATQAGNYKYCANELGKEELLGKTLSISSIITPSAENKGQIAVYFGKSNIPSTQRISAFASSGSITFTIPTTFPEDCDRIWVLFYANTDGTGNVGDYVDYTDLVISVTDKPIKYKPYRASDVYVDKNIGKWSVAISSILTLSNGNIGSAVAPIPTKKRTGTSTILAEKAIFVQSYEPGTCYENPANVVFVGTSTDTLATMQEKYNGGFLQYRLETPTEISLSNYSTQDITILTETNSVKDWTIDDERYVPDVGFFGQFTAKELTGNLQNITDDFNIEDKYVEVRMGLSKFKSTTTNWYSLGTYIISKPNDDEVSDNTKYTGYDLTILFNIPFDANFTNDAFTKSFNDMLKEQSYVTNGWLANYTCAQVGIKLGTTNFIHSDFKILSNQFTSGETCRDIMKYISELAFGYCEVDWDDICYIRTLNKEYANFDKYHKLNYDQYYSLETQKKSYGPVNRVFCGLQDVDGQGHELIDGNSTSTDTTTINIYNNPLTMGTTLEISDQLQLEAIQGCDILWGIQYRPITKMETIGHPWLKAYEPIEVSDMELNKIITYPFTNTLKYTGHIKSDISSEGETKTEDTYGYKDTVERRMNRIGINVDRANKEITIINQEITKIDDDIKDIRGNMITIGDVYTKSEIRDIVSGVGVDGTVVTSLETATTIFDINGMTIGRTDAQTKTNVNANGMIISNANDNTELLKINNQGVYSENLTARTYLNFGTHGRFEKYNESGHDRIGCFWIEGDE